MNPMPSFTAEDVELLESAVQMTLEHLRTANEKLGGNDSEMLATGRRYALLLQKLQAVSSPSAA